MTHNLNLEGEGSYLNQRKLFPDAFPLSVDQLREGCIELQPIGEGLVLAPGRLLPVPDWSQKAPYNWYAFNNTKYEMLPDINGTYGLMLESLKSVGELLAFAGFSINQDEMRIAHTPQGNTTSTQLSRAQHAISHTSRNELMLLDFRSLMMNAMVEIARKLNVQRIKGIAAQNHEKVLETKQLDLKVGQKVIDQVFRNSGFQQSSTDGNFYLEF